MSDVAPHYQQNQRTLQAFTSLLTLVEALATITDQAEKIVHLGIDITSPITLATAGQAFAEITKQVLDCAYVGVFALDPPNEIHRMLGTDGLPPQEVEILRKDTYQVPMSDYVDAADLERLRTNQIVMLDLKEKPFATPRSAHGARYRLVAPVVLHGRLSGLFTMAKTDAIYPDIQSAYSPEEIALAKGIARLAGQVIEKVDLLQQKAEAQAKEQKLQEAAYRYKDFLITASHELRTPLTTIKGNVQLAQRRVMALEERVTQPPFSPDVDALRRIECPLQATSLHFARLERMIHELIDFSRIQAERFEMQKQPCNLGEIVRQAVNEVQQNVYISGRKWLLSLPTETVVPIIADSARIRDVLQNYLGNAHTYSPVDRPITVSLTVDGSVARVAVRDEGPGIAPVDQERIWERFYCVPGKEFQEMPPLTSNLGLGLYLCREIIELHQGHVGVESRPGRGAIFWFTLTLAHILHEPGEGSDEAFPHAFE